MCDCVRHVETALQFLFWVCCVTCTFLFGPSHNLSPAVLQEHHEEDLFLYMTYSNESVYGA